MLNVNLGLLSDSYNFQELPILVGRIEVYLRQLLGLIMMDKDTGLTEQQALFIMQNEPISHEWCGKLAKMVGACHSLIFVDENDNPKSLETVIRELKEGGESDTQLRDYLNSNIQICIDKQIAALSQT